MRLHPVLTEKLSAAVALTPVLPATRRDARLPEVPMNAFDQVLVEVRESMQ
jgi:hypothetical protein